MLDRPTTTAERADFDLNQKVIRYWSILFHEIVDLRGKPLAVVQRLGNPSLVIDPGKRAPEGQPRLVQFMGPGIDGGWKNLGPPSAEGKDLLELLMWLGAVSGLPRVTFCVGLSIALSPSRPPDARHGLKIRTYEQLRSALANR
jgi:hypothetical protein